MDSVDQGLLQTCKYLESVRARLFNYRVTLAQTEQSLNRADQSQKEQQESHQRTLNELYGARTEIFNLRHQFDQANLTIRDLRQELDQYRSTNLGQKPSETGNQDSQQETNIAQQKKAHEPLPRITCQDCQSAVVSAEEEVAAMNERNVKAQQERLKSPPLVDLTASEASCEAIQKHEAVPKKGLKRKMCS
ncbi:MAG: hypothetical protein M1821_004661 [Bathelium mastoideum]|nr:MAG: hypothetical protein M1821_004661 [Bathelium mastoideum]